MQDIFEQAKRDALISSVKDFYLKNKKLSKNIVTFLFVLIAAGFWWSHEKAEQIERSSLQLFQAIQSVESNDLDKAIMLLDNMPSKYNTGYTVLSKFLAADLLMQKRDTERAMSIYLSIMREADDTYAQLAHVKYLHIRAFTLSVDEALEAINALMAKAPAWKTSLLELTAMVYLNAKDYDNALMIYEKILADIDGDKDLMMRINLAKLACQEGKGC